MKRAFVVVSLASSPLWTGCGTDSSPSFAASPTQQTTLAVADSGGCVVRAGALYCWGDNDHAGVGTSTTQGAIPVPVRVEGADWQSVGRGHHATCGVRGDALYCWGYASEGPLGQVSPDHDLVEPTRVGADGGWTRVSVSYYHACGLRSGALYCWGTEPRYFGAALNGAHGAVSFARTEDARVPLRMHDANDWTAVATGFWANCGIRSDQLYCWGREQNGELGVGGDSNDTNPPRRVGQEADWQAVSVGKQHACGIRAGGRLYCWGKGSDGRLGLGDEADRNVPTRVGTDEGWTAIAAAEGSCGVRAGRVYCWGEQFPGSSAGPAPFTNFSKIVQVALGEGSLQGDTYIGNQGCVRDDVGRCFCWGKNDRGQLGSGSTGPSSKEAVPVLLPSN